MQYSKYYEEILYPFQDKVLTILRSCETPFYLTGGTAVSRGYLHHRYSDDLDLFVNNDNNFHSYVEKVLSAFEKSEFSIDYSEVSAISFTRIFLNKNKSGLDNGGLKIDFVNDVEAHFGNIQSTPVYYRTDSLRNMLSNKYTALYRIAVKDIADICEIAQHISFDGKDIIDEANQKEGGIDLKEIVQIFSAFDDDMLRSIKWVNAPDICQFRNVLNTVAFDMVHERRNSLCA